MQPKETTQGSYEVFTVRVPSENETVPTTKIEVKVPAEVNISRLEPKPGWTYELQKDASEKITVSLGQLKMMDYRQLNLVSS